MMKKTKKVTVKATLTEKELVKVVGGKAARIDLMAFFNAIVRRRKR